MIINPYRFAAAGGGGSDPDFASVSLLIHCDGTNGSTTFTDNSSIGHTVTANGNAQVSTSSPKFGTGSLLLDGSGDNLTVADNAAFDFGTGDFTIEFWIKWTSTTGYQVAYDHGYTGGIALETGNGAGRFVLYLGGASVCTESSSLGTGTWGFYQIVRSGTTVTIYRDGVSTASGTSSANLAPSATLYLGSYSSGAYGINGNMDDIRITKGVARANAVPTAAHPDS